MVLLLRFSANPIFTNQGQFWKIEQGAENVQLQLCPSIDYHQENWKHSAYYLDNWKYFTGYLENWESSIDYHQENWKHSTDYLDINFKF